MKDFIRLMVIFGLYSQWTLTLGEDYHRYFWANYQQFMGNHTDAGRWYHQLFDTAQSKYCFKGYMHHLLSTGQLHKVLALIEPMKDTYGDDSEVQHIFVLALKQVGRIKDADDLVMRLSQKFKSDQNITIQAVEALVRRKELTNAISIIDGFLNSNVQRPNFFIFHFLKAQIYQQMGDLKKAYDAVQETIALHPQFPQAWLLYALLEEQAGKYKEALSGYTHFMQTSDQPNPQIEQRIAQLAAKMHQHTMHGSHTKSCYEKAMLLFKKQHYQQALFHINACLKQDPKNQESRVLKIHILLGLPAIDQAIDALVSWIQEKPFDALWVKTLHLLARAGAPKEKIIKAFEGLEQHGVQEFSADLYLADLYLRAHQEEKALVYLQKIAAKTADTKIKTRTLFQIGLLHYTRGEWEKARNALEKGYALDSTFMPLVNLLAFGYAQHVPEKRDNALEMVQALLKRYPSNVHILDTKAFILYKQKNFDGAQALLESLVGKQSKDSTVLLHLAKVYRKKHLEKQGMQLLSQAAEAAKSLHEKQQIEKAGKKWKIAQGQSV